MAQTIREPSVAYARNTEIPTFFGQPMLKGVYADLDAARSDANTSVLFYSHPNGEIWTGDAIAWLRSLPAGSADLVFADPPYNIGKAEWDTFESQRQYVAWSLQWIEQAARVLKPTGTLYVCGFSEILADLRLPASRFFRGCRWLIWHYKNKANLGNDLCGLVLLTGCASSQPQAAPTAVSQPGDVTMKLTSSAFTEGNMIPKKYTCDGDDASPPLAWRDAPAGTKSLALICDDPDAPAGTWMHWVLFDLPPTLTGLPEAMPPDKAPKIGGAHGTNSWRKFGYGGPCPPSGTHRYFFKLYALDTQLNLGNSATAKDVQAAMKGHVVGEAQLMGRYKR